MAGNADKANYGRNDLDDEDAGNESDARYAIHVISIIVGLIVDGENLITCAKIFLSQVIHRRFLDQRFDFGLVSTLTSYCKINSPGDRSAISYGKRIGQSHSSRIGTINSPRA